MSLFFVIKKSLHVGRTFLGALWNDFVRSRYWFVSGKTRTDLQQRFCRKEAIAQFTGDQQDGKFTICRRFSHWLLQIASCTSIRWVEKFELKLGKISTFLCAIIGREPASWQSVWLMIKTKILDVDESRNGCRVKMVNHCCCHSRSFKKTFV